MIPSHELYYALSIAAHSVPDEKPSMPALCSLLIEFPTPDTMYVVGTDGERIAVVTLGLEHLVPTGTSFRMSPDSARTVLNGLTPVPRGRASLCIFGDQLFATMNDQCITADRLQDDLTYPDWSKVMTSGRPQKWDPVPFERSLLADALVALAPVCETVMVDINGRSRRGYIDAVLRDGFECIKAVRIGVSQRTGGA